MEEAGGRVDRGAPGVLKSSPPSSKQSRLRSRSRNGAHEVGHGVKCRSGASQVWAELAAPTLYRLQKRRNVRRQIRERAHERLREPVRKHEVEELVHVLCQRLADGRGEHAYALEDGHLGRSVLPAAVGSSKMQCVSPDRSCLRDGHLPRAAVARPSLTLELTDPPLCLPGPDPDRVTSSLSLPRRHVQ